MTLYLCDGCGAKSNVWAAIVHAPATPQNPEGCPVAKSAQTIDYDEVLDGGRVVHVAAARAVKEGSSSRKGAISPALIDGLSFRGSPLVSTPTADDGLTGTATRGRP